jgi:predicted signal transduction protein with EAL and GGDEF domain
MVAERLLDCLPSDSIACRFGGDEFVIAVPLSRADKTEEWSTEIADRLIFSLSEKYILHNAQAVSLSASIGCSSHLNQNQTISDTILFADAAMYRAKHLGKRRWVRYQTGMEKTIQRHSLISQNLLLAEKNQELSLHYQPIFDFSENTQGEIVAFEALLRWHNLKLGWVPPEEIIKVAEENGVLGSIEWWVARQALNDLSILRKHVSSKVTMSINMTATHLLDPHLADNFLLLLKECQLDATDVTVELTESALIENIDKDSSAVKRLVAEGVKISIDDFGTGYSSLAYLHQIPASIVKIDRSFVDLATDNNQTIHHIKELIETHNMKALIEGIETEAQREKLIEFGINIHQGYLLGKPQPLSYYLKKEKQ